MTETRRSRVLVVDDSAFARKVLREVLSRSPELEVVGIARDGLEALEKIAELSPDVVTLDLVMPGLDGLGMLRELPKKDAPRVVIVSISDEQSELVVEALQLGAVDFVQKPTSLATERLYELGAELVAKVVAAAAARSAERRSVAPLPAPAPSVGTELVVVGTSTGGPQALTALLSALPGDLPCALALALHIPADYTPALARRLDAACAIDVREAAEGLELRPGRAVLARGGVHLEVVRRGPVLVAHLTSAPVMIYTPSVDVLFTSAARACGSSALGVVLTGMGDDGLAGARALRARGARILTEAESTCVVYGMPRALAEEGLSSEEVPLHDMAAAVLRAL